MDEDYLKVPSQEDIIGSKSYAKDECFGFCGKISNASLDANKIPLVILKDNLLDLMGTHFLICTEKIKGNGEDSGIEIYTHEAGLMGAFDGCGGLGARSCIKASYKTEAYLASRAIGNAAMHWFDLNINAGYKWEIAQLRDIIISNLQKCQSLVGESIHKLKGTMIRPFPSTVAIVTFKISDKRLISNHIWAGDSRTYILDASGISQVSTDDVNSIDAMSNLLNDGALTNVVAADNNFALHSTQLEVKHPCIIMCATDGCFGYVSSPMEFEFMLLSTLNNASSVDDWEDALRNEISMKAGDDQTLAVAAFGFETFSEMKQYFNKRTEEISTIMEFFNSSNAEEKQHLWKQYSTNYYKYSEMGSRHL